MIELYHFWDSPCCFKVRMVLDEKGLEWRERYVMTPKFDHFQPDYVALNPHSKVPALVDDGLVVIQSSNIAEYLDDRYPEPPLAPADAVARATMRAWMAEEQEYLFPLIVTMSFNIMMKLRAVAYGMDVLTEWSKRHPDQARAQDYLRRVTDPADTAAVAAAEARFRWHLERLEAELQPGPWICGETYSLADICVAPILDRVDHLDRAHLWEDLPRVADWYVRMKERPAFAAAAPPFDYRMWGPKKPVPEGGVDAATAGNTFPG